MADENQKRDIPTLTCKCGKPFEVFMPKADVSENQTFSAIVWAHPEAQKCPYCGQAYQMMIAKLMGFEVTWIPLKQKEDSNIVVAGADALNKLPPPKIH